MLSDVEIIEPATFERSEIYNEHLARVGVRYTLFSLAPSGPGLTTAPAGPFGAADIARVRALLPHICRVIRLRDLLHAMCSKLDDLAEGRTLAEFAEVRGCSEQTARTHLKRILDKTQTKRQADLVRVLLSGAALHHAHAARTQ